MSTDKQCCEYPKLNRHGVCSRCGYQNPENEKALDRFIEMVRENHTRKPFEEKP